MASSCPAVAEPNQRRGAGRSHGGHVRRRDGASGRLLTPYPAAVDVRRRYGAAGSSSVPERTVVVVPAGASGTARTTFEPASTRPIRCPATTMWSCGENVTVADTASPGGTASSSRSPLRDHLVAEVGSASPTGSSARLLSSATSTRSASFSGSAIRRSAHAGQALEDPQRQRHHAPPQLLRDAARRRD